jgi:nucleoside-diphosphate-sugar epimerase
MTKDIEGIHFLVTGSSGYIGQHLVEELLLRGSYVTLLTSSKVDLTNPRLRNVKWSLHSKGYELATLNLENNFPQPAALIHLAYSWINALDHEGQNINLIGTLTLYKWAKEKSIKFIFASSVSAREGALNEYGKIKFLIEQSFDIPHAVIARIGLVYGGRKLSQWGQLCNLVGKTRVLPMVDPWVRVQPIHVEKVIEGIICIAIQKNLSRKTYTLATSKDVSFGDFLKLISEQKFHRSLLIVPISSKFIINLLKQVPKNFINTTAIKDRIFGLIGIIKVDNVEELKELNLEVGDIKISDAVEFADEQIALEAILVMKSIVNKHPNPSSIRKYILAIKQYHQGKLYPFPFWVVSPIFLRFIEPLPFNNSKNIQESDLLGRFNWALGILESGELAPLVYNYRPDKSNRITLLWFFISEIVFLPIRWLYWKLKQ